MSNEAPLRTAASDAADVLGTFPIVLGGPFGGESDAVSTARLEAFRDAGGTVVETAFSYMGGQSIRALGSRFRSMPGVFDAVVKIGHRGRGEDMPLTVENIVADTDESRSVLDVDRIGIVLIHNDDPERDVEAIADALDHLVSSGRARAVGISNWTAPRLTAGIAALTERGHLPLASYHRSLAVPDPAAFHGSTLPGDDAVFDVVSDRAVPLLSWSANAGGYFAAADGPAAGSGDEPGDSPFDSPASRARRARCRLLAATLGTDPATVALAWTLGEPRTWASVGTGSVDRLRSTLTTPGLALDAEQRRWLRDG